LGSSDLSYVSPPGLAAPQLIFGHGLGHQLPPTAASIALSGSRPIHICPCRRSCPRRYGNYGSDGWSPADGFPPPSPGEQRPAGDLPGRPARADQGRRPTRWV